MITKADHGTATSEATLAVLHVSVEPRSSVSRTRCSAAIRCCKRDISSSTDATFRASIGESKSVALRSILLIRFRMGITRLIAATTIDKAAMSRQTPGESNSPMMALHRSSPKPKMSWLARKYRTGQG